MKQSIKTITLALIAGFIGSFLYSLAQEQLFSNAYDSNATQPEKATLVNNNGFEKSSIKVDFTEASEISTQSVVYIRKWTTFRTPIIRFWFWSDFL